MIEEQRSAGAGGCCVFQRGCLLESYDLARAAVMGAHGVLLPALQGFLLLSRVVFVSGMLWSERGLHSVLCREQGLSSVLCREQGLSIVLCCQPSAPLMEGA